MAMVGYRLRISDCPIGRYFALRGAVGGMVEERRSGLDDKTRRLLREMESHRDPVQTVADLAEVLDVSETTALRRLQSAHDAGYVQRKEVGASAVVWWPVPDLGGQDVEIDWTPKTDDEIADGLIQFYVRKLDFRGESHQRQERQACMLAAVTGLRELRSVEKSDLLRIALAPALDEYAYYGTEESFWNNLVLPSLRHLRDEHGLPIEYTGGKWRWTAEGPGEWMPSMEFDGDLDDLPDFLEHGPR